MSWDNYGAWEIDHIIPLLYNDPSTDEITERLHWTNTQPMWQPDNAKKGNRFIGSIEDQPKEPTVLQLMILHS